MAAKASPEKSSNRINMDAYCAWDGDTLVLNILGTPSAKKDVVGKVKGSQLKVSVTAEPTNGKATDHMVKFLAPIFGVNTKDIEVVFGRFNINKQLRVKSPKKLPKIIEDFFAETAKSTHK